ncbi:MAG: pcm [Myxococcaceae bacterium]|nr:pcm [Myxococcaceae bacterium]
MRLSKLAVWAAAAVLVECTRTAPRADREAGTTTLSSAVVPLDAGGAASRRALLDTEAARSRREALVRSLAESGSVYDEHVLDAMRRVPRHLFLPGTPLGEAYSDQALPIGSGQTISQPTIVAEMTEALELQGNERVLEVGTGSGYQAAILSVLVREVYTIEIVRDLGERAQKRLRDLGYANVRVRVGDGYAGWPEAAPFERIVVTAAPPEVPQALLDQLAEGGILVAPVGEPNEKQWLTRVRKKDGKLTRERLDAVHFVPMVPSRPRR